MPNIKALDRLKSQLLTSGLQTKDLPLFQVINQLIDFMRQSIDFTQELANDINSPVLPPIHTTNTALIGGMIGLDGQEGEDGPPGPPGRIGIDGVAGAQGSAGIGVPGIDGIDGEDGMSLPSSIPGPAGPIGATGAIGPIGFGLPGLDGIDGLDGEAGIPGPQGFSGIPGSQGIPGPPGIMVGIDGEDGDEGPMGFPGIPGPAGADGGGASPVAGEITITDAAQGAATVNVSNEGTIDWFMTRDDTYPPAIQNYPCMKILGEKMGLSFRWTLKGSVFGYTTNNPKTSVNAGDSSYGTFTNYDKACGVYNSTAGILYAGYMFTCLARKESRTLVLYINAYSCIYTVTARLSDGSHADVTLTSNTGAATSNQRRTEIVFNSSEDNAILSVSVNVTTNHGGNPNVALIAATLFPTP